MRPELVPPWGESWEYEEWFALPNVSACHPAVKEAESYLVDRHIENHPFFIYAASSRAALKAWVSQEVVVTGFFSQALLKVASAIRNVHLRSMVVEVIDGEHGCVEGNAAKRSHPWLLHRLRESLAMNSHNIRPLEETQEFLDLLFKECEDPLKGVGALGMGNERLLLPEYGALRKAFERCWPECEYEGFLDANLRADAEHARMLGVVASALIEGGGNAESYLAAAKRSVDSRLRYHDKLLARFKTG